MRKAWSIDWDLKLLSSCLFINIQTFTKMILILTYEAFKDDLTAALHLGHSNSMKNHLQNLNRGGHTNLKDPILWSSWNDVSKFLFKCLLISNQNIFIYFCPLIISLSQKFESHCIIDRKFSLKPKFLFKSFTENFLSNPLILSSSQKLSFYYMVDRKMSVKLKF